MLILIIEIKSNPCNSNKACVNSIFIFQNCKKLFPVVYVLKCYTTFQLRWYASHFSCCVQKILLNLLQSRPCLRVTSVHSCMPLQSWVGLCGLPLELHLMKLVRPLPVTMVKKTIELLAIRFMFNSLPLSPCKKHSRLSCPVYVQTVLAQGTFNVYVFSFVQG